MNHAVRSSILVQSSQLPTFYPISELHLPDISKMQPMRALTLHQPWASLIALGYKTTETRSWPAPKTLVGSRVAIHAARRRPRRSEWNIRVANAMAGRDLPLGAIVATARVDGCVRVLSNGFAKMSEPADPGRVRVVDRFGQEHRDAYQMVSDPYGDYSEGRWIWLLSRVRPVKPPIEATGNRGVWTPPSQVQARLKRSYRRI